jgi:hypothetical protein
MKFKNFTIYFFAVIGFVVIACSAAAAAESIDDNPDDNPPVVQSNIGKYVITSITDMNLLDYEAQTVVVKDRLAGSFIILNTETGQWMLKNISNSDPVIDAWNNVGD